MLSVIVLSGLIFTSCEVEEDNNDGNQNNSSSLPAAATGSYNMEVTFADGNAPYNLGQVAEFNFTASGMMEIDLDPSAGNGAEVSLGNASKNGAEYIWTDAANSTEYILSLTTEDSVNEVNVFVSGNFVNQWSPAISGQQNIGLIKNMAGQYTVSSTTSGNHNRGTVIISANGDIDFDNGISFTASQYNLISNRIDILGEVFIDIEPYPTEPYPRITIKVDASTPTVATGMSFAPNYPNGSGSVAVDF